MYFGYVAKQYSNTYLIALLASVRIASLYEHTHYIMLVIKIFFNLFETLLSKYFAESLILVDEAFTMFAQGFSNQIRKLSFL
jgi:hypothetical protein